MKIRNGFVSNSSSSSFVISIDKISSAQIALIEEHLYMAEKFMNKDTSVDFGSLNESDRWDITSEDEFIKGETFMDNFDMHEYLTYIGVDPDDVEWDY